MGPSHSICAAQRTAFAVSCGLPPRIGTDDVAIRHGSFHRNVAWDPVATCMAAYNVGETPDRVSEKTAVKRLTQLLVAKAPGNSVEVRVPPYSAVQVVEGTRHRRGTPPTVRCDAKTFIQLATGAITWRQAIDSGDLIASGEHQRSHRFTAACSDAACLDQPRARTLEQ